MNNANRIDPNEFMDNKKIIHPNEFMDKKLSCSEPMNNANRI